MLKPFYEFTNDGGIEFKFTPSQAIDFPLIKDLVSAPEISIENPLASIPQEALSAIEDEEEREILECALLACSDYVWTKNGKPIKSANPIYLLQNAINALVDLQFEDSLTDSVTLKPVFNFREDGFGFSSQILDNNDMRFIFRIRYNLDDILNDESLTDKQRDFIKLIFPGKHKDLLSALMFAIQNLWEYYDRYGALYDPES